jgi:hypothetical protein
MYFAELVFLRLICPIRKIKTQPNQTGSRRHFLGQKPFCVSEDDSATFAENPDF